MIQSAKEENGELHDGLIVWDHEGVVVVWPDGHRSRFSWASLRALCSCKECQQQERRPPVFISGENVLQWNRRGLKKRGALHERMASLRRNGLMR